MLDNLVRKLEALGGPDTTGRIISSLFASNRRVAAGEDIVREGPAAPSVNVLLEGFCSRYRQFPDGRRQIMSFQIPGDVFDLQSLLLNELDYSVAALAPSRVAAAPHNRLLEAFDAEPDLATAFWRLTLVDGAIGREWLVGLGRRSAYGRIAHLLCEVMARLKAAGLTDGSTCHLPLTQQELADSLGLSLVHVNRILQRLRASGMVRMGRGSLHVHDWEGLKQAGDFDSAYLRLPSA